MEKFGSRHQLLLRLIVVGGGHRLLLTRAGRGSARQCEDPSAPHLVQGLGNDGGCSALQGERER